MEDELKVDKHVINQHTQYIREYELRQNIYENSMNVKFADKIFEFGEDFKRHLALFDRKLLNQRIEMSDEMQIVLKNSRDELLKAFRKEYYSKRVAKGTQANHLESTEISVEIQVAEAGVMGPVRIPEIEIEEGEERAKSQYRPRRDKMPRAYTPPTKWKRGKYQLFPNSRCCTNSSVSSLASSLVRERAEDIEMRKLLEERRIREAKRQAELAAQKAREEAEKLRKKKEEEEMRRREKEDA